MELIDAFLFSSVRATTPLLLIGLGVLVGERSGVINLGQEGLVILGAASAFAIAAGTGSPWLGIGAGIMASVCLSAVFALLTLGMNANQVASGLALTILGTGLGAAIGSDQSGVSIVGLSAIPIPFLSDIPLLGPGLFQHDLVVYLTMALIPARCWLVNRSPQGLRFSAVGHNPAASRRLGLPVTRIQLIAVLSGGALSGLAGAWLAVVYTPIWSESISSGRGWIALALVIFGGWRVIPVLIGAWIFGASSVAHLGLQGFGFSASPQLMSMLPYVLTLALMLVLTGRRFRWRADTPRALGTRE
ncbi:MAG: ABC transporter permease [Pseudomonadales bacterium]